MTPHQAEAFFAEAIDAVDFIAFLQQMNMPYRWQWHSAGVIIISYAWHSRKWANNRP
jgi:hypothetical protein